MNDRNSAQKLTNRAFAIVERGRQEHRKGNFEVSRQLLEEALRSIDIALEADPDYEHAYNERSFVLGNLQRYEEAAACSRKAILLAPEVPKFHIGLIAIGIEHIRSLKSRKERKSAAEPYFADIEKLMKRFPKYPSTYLARAALQAMTDVGQSAWEESLSKAAKRYFKMVKISSGEPASEAGIAEALKANTHNCLELQREWDRLPD